MKFSSYLLLFVFGISQISFSADSHFKMRANYFEHKKNNYIAISFKNEKGWHSYWKNPGDAGLPVKIIFDKIQPKELNWPAPTTYIQQDVLSYGYSDVFTFFFKLSPKQKEQLASGYNKIETQLLICHEICIPGHQTINVKLDGNKITHLNGSDLFKITLESIKESFLKLPKQTVIPPSFDIKIKRLEDKLYLSYFLDTKSLMNYKQDTNLLTPYLHPLLGFKKEDLYFNSDTNQVQGLTEITWDGEYAEPPVDLPTPGQLASPLTLDLLLQYNEEIIKTKVVLDTLGQLSVSDISSIKRMKVFDTTNLGAGSNTTKSILSIILFALIGGFILNFMPCVLPVISIKLMGLVHARQLKGMGLLKHNLTYTAGVLSTFMLLAAAIHLIKASGTQIGWGFQLQSPTFVFFVTLVIFVMALNMFGLFEFKTPGGSALGSKNLKDSFFGDFFSGVISTILSTPCSAPFLGTALTFAFTTSNINIYIIFLSIGVGLASPFILIGFFPKMISFLPKPGMWMQKFKYFLGITLLLTVFWLMTVVFQLTLTINSIYLLLAVMLAITMALWLPKKIGKKGIAVLVIWLFPIIGITSFFQLNFHTTKTPQISKTLNGNWTPWSPATMTTSKIKFINFTAAWCLTCKVNKKLVLDTDRFYKFSKDNNINLYEADWTHRDDNITEWLGRYNVVGVPAYFIQKENGEIVHLGETTSIGEIEEALEI